MQDIEVRHATHPDEMAALDTEALRRRFLVPDLFQPGQVRLTLSHHDRLVVGGVVPAGAELPLPAPAELRAERFCDRRELAVVCLDGSGVVTVDGDRYPMQGEDVLYVGRGAGRVVFGGDAGYYLVSAPAHAANPTALVRPTDAASQRLGEAATANLRTIRKYVHPDGAASCQLTLGITTLAEGSVWNTMPCHTHDRRTEVYLYFGLAGEDRVVHLCGRPDATRSMIVADRQAVISPSWSVHCGAGTGAYRFVWATAGENSAWDDMEPVPVGGLR